jgi:hypothetical protein
MRQGDECVRNRATYVLFPLNHPNGTVRKTKADAERHSVLSSSGSAVTDPKMLTGKRDTCGVSAKRGLQPVTSESSKGGKANEIF